MRQRTKNHRNQGSIEKKIRFFSKFLRHISRWVRFVQKTRWKNSHAWAPLTIQRSGSFPSYWYLLLKSIFNSKKGNRGPELDPNSAYDWIRIRIQWIWILRDTAMIMPLRHLLWWMMRVVSGTCVSSSTPSTILTVRTSCTPHRDMFIYNIYNSVTKTFMRSAFAIAIDLFWNQK